MSNKKIYSTSSKKAYSTLGIDVAALAQQTSDLQKMSMMFSPKPAKSPTIKDKKHPTNDEILIQDMHDLTSFALSVDAEKEESLGDFFERAYELSVNFKKIAEAAEEKPRSSMSAESEIHKALSLADKIELYFKALQPYLKMAQPINNWRDIDAIYKLDHNDEVIIVEVAKDLGFQFTVDETTKKLYCSDDAIVLRAKLFLLILGTCTINLIALLANSVYMLAKIITVYELRNRDNTAITNLKNYGSDIARLVFGPLVLLGMQITAVLGTITPTVHGTRDARKMYALGESLIFGFGAESWRLAPCFRADPKYHLFGGEIGKKNQW